MWQMDRRVGVYKIKHITMIEYEDIKGPASKHERIIRIYSNRVVLNARACYVLCNPANPRIGFRIVGNNVSSISTPLKVYIIPEASEGFRVTNRKGRSSGYINSVRLCRSLMAILGAAGAYKLEEIPTKFLDGRGYRILPDRLVG